MSAQTDPWIEYCRRLNKHYRQGNLRILAGAGLSIDSGFPTWGELNRALLRKYIEEDLGSDPKAQPIVRQHLDELVQELYNSIGREAAADFVWNSSTRENFFEDLRRVLYNGREFVDLPLTPVHLQLTAMDRAAIFTMNFDPLLELARYRATGGQSREPDLTPYRSANPPLKGTAPDTGKIYHVHGWIDPDGICGGSFVLTESQYFELFSRQAQRPNQMLDYALTSGGAVLILGMSLADVNLRRQLYMRANSRISDSTEIYAVLRGNGRQLLDAYQTLHWANRGVRLIYVEDYDGISAKLREIKFGFPAEATGPSPWMSETLRWVNDRLPKQLIFSDEWQTIARTTLVEFVSQIRESFAVNTQEVIHVSLMGQVNAQQIASFADTRHSFTGKEAEDYARQFRLRIGHRKAQGVAGVAFSQGRPYEVLNDPEFADQNFTPAMKQFYDRKLRNWRSLMAIPILQTPDQLPVLVAAISSNLGEPFWTNKGEETENKRHQISQALELVVRELVSSSSKPS
ncbi:MAG: SIR2 family protein [Bryobacteraceae bacterium]